MSVQTVIDSLTGGRFQCRSRRLLIQSDGGQISVSVQTVIDTVWRGADFSVGPDGYWYSLTGGRFQCRSRRLLIQSDGGQISVSVQTVIDTVWRGADFSVGPDGYWYSLTGGQISVSVQTVIDTVWPGGRFQCRSRRLLIQSDRGADFCVGPDGYWYNLTGGQISVSVQTVIDTIWPGGRFLCRSRRLLIQSDRGADFSVGPDGYCDLQSDRTGFLNINLPSTAVTTGLRKRRYSIFHLCKLHHSTFLFFWCVFVEGVGGRFFLYFQPLPPIICCYSGDKHTYCASVSCFVCFLEQIMRKRFFFF